MSFKVTDKKLLKHYTKKWEKVSNLMDISKKVPKENASYRCLSLIMLDSVVKVKNKYYPQTVLEERNHEIKKTKIENLINDELKSSSSVNENESDSDNKSDNESDNE